MYGKLPQRKMTRQDQMLDCQVTRSQLATYIDEQNRRVNIDSAKKKAVIQRFDYQGFRQMVLGANLFCLKTKELLAFSQGDHKQHLLQIAQPLLPNSGVKSLNKVQEIKDQEILQELMNKRLISQLICNNFRDFKKWTDKFYVQPLTPQSCDRILHLIKSQTQQKLQKVFGSQFDSKYLIKLIRVLNFAKLNILLPQKMVNQASFILNFFSKVVSFRKFRVSLNLLLPKQKTQIKSFFDGLQQCYEAETQPQVKEIIEKINRSFD